MRIVTATLVLMLGTPGVSLAQAQTPQDRIDTALARARQAGLPVALLESKVAEGRAKGVSLDRIASAVERRAVTLERANRALEGQAGLAAPELSVAADALESGVSDAVLRALAETAPRDRRVVALAALTQLVEAGHAPETALDRVRAALRRGPEALLNLPTEATGPGGGRGSSGRQPPGPGTGAGGGRGAAPAGPPSGVPAPGNPAQVSRPGGPPADTAAQGRSSGSGNASGAGRGRGN